MKSILSILIALLVCSFGETARAAVVPTEVSITALLANPQRYSGKLVRVIGFAKFETKANALYLHEEDYRHRIFKNGISLDIPANIYSIKDEFDEKYVVVEGLFTDSDNGPMGRWTGKLFRIGRFQLQSRTN